MKLLMPASEMALLSLRLRTMPETFSVSTPMLAYRLAIAVVALCWKSCLRWLTRACSLLRLR